MSPAARTDSLLQARSRSNVIHNIVGAVHIATHARRHVIEAEAAARSPRNVVVCTRAITAYANGAEQGVRTII